MQVAFRLIGESLISRENFGQAEGVAHRAVSERERSLPRDHPQDLRSHLLLSQAHQFRGRSEEMNHYEEDKAAAKEAFELARKWLGTSDPETIDCVSPRHQSCTEIGRDVPGWLTCAALMGGLWLRRG